jgi:two-component system, OmpR family, sensor histidine kinase MtrB
MSDVDDTQLVDVTAQLPVVMLRPVRLGWRRRLARLWNRLRPPKPALRRRIFLTFSLGTFALSAVLAAATYSFTRSSLLRQRDRTAIDQAFRNAGTIQADLGSQPSAAQITNRLRGVGVVQAVVAIEGQWLSTSSFGRADIPEALQKRVLDDFTAARMITLVNGGPELVVGVPLPDQNAAYFEFSNLSEVQSTLSGVGRSLLAASVVTTGIGMLLGALAASRAVRPLADAAQAAKAIAGGRLDTRLEPTDDPDLRVLANSFNDMASALQARVERDARFTSDVSHELRSPLMTLSASAEVLNSRRDELPDEKSRAALDYLVGDVKRFQGLVEDLLEISRFDAGAIRLNREDLVLAEFVRQAVAVSSVPDATVRVTDRGEGLIIAGDKRRLARVVANLLDNARFYGGGEISVDVSEALGESEPLAHAWIAVEDHGAGVPVEERTLVFERFARGGSAGRRSLSEGAGLGLALVDEDVRMHGGRVWVEDRRDGQSGARFVIELPAEEVGT